MPGMHGSVTAVTSLQKADLLIALGTRFDDRVTGQLDTFAPHAAVIHADIDPAEIGKNRAADVPIVGDVREVLTELIPAVEAEFAAGQRADLTGWWAQLDQLAQRPIRSATTSPPTAASPRSTSSSASARSAVPTRSTSPGSGQHQMWAAQFISLREARHVAQLRRRRDDGVRRAGGDGRQGRPARTPSCGPSTATAASR